MESKLFDVFSNLADDEIIEISDIELDCQLDELTIIRIKTASFKKVGLRDEVCESENVRKKFSIWKKVVVVAACITIVFSILGTTGFSQYIYRFWTSKVTLGNGREEITLDKEVRLIHINETAPKTDLADISLQKAEDIIGVKFLHSEMYSNDALQYKPIIPNKEIEAIDLWYAFCVVYGNDENNKYISGSFRLYTDKATEHVIPNEDIDATGGKELLRSFKSSNLNTNVVLYKVDWSEARITAVFDYMNVHYTFIGNNVSETEMIKFIDSLK